MAQVWAHGGDYPYPSNLGPFSKSWWTVTRAATDSVPGLGHCGVRSVARMLEKGGSPSVHTYLFAHPTQAPPGLAPLSGPGAVVVPHAFEIPYAFGQESALRPVQGDEMLPLYLGLPHTLCGCSVVAL